MIQKRWIKVVAIGMGISGTIISTTYLAMYLVKMGKISLITASIIIVLVVVSELALMVFYALKRKNS